MSLLRINEKREELLIPFLKWRYLGINELKSIANYSGSERGLQRFVRRMEDEGILISFIHKLSNKKYVQLTRAAYNEISDSRWNLNEDIKMHDAIVSTVLYKFSQESFVSLTEMNYQDVSLNQSIFSSGIDPDGMIRAKRNGQEFNIAIEIELTRKNSTEIFKKFKRYHENTSFEWVIYFFKSKKTLKTYFRYYEEFRKLFSIEASSSQIILCYSDDLASSNFSSLDSYWKHPNGSELSLKDFFYAM